MLIAKANVVGGAARIAALVACGLGLAGCETLSSINPFDRTEKYTMEIVPEVPAEQLYNDGLARLQRSDTEGAAKKFSEVEKQYPYSDWSRRGMLMTAFAHYQGLRYDDSINASRR